MNVSSTIRRAVVLAAGLGSRIRETEEAPPKPLCEVHGVSLLTRTLLTLAAGGIERAIVIVGFMSERVQAAVAADPELARRGPATEIVFNPDYRQANGVSVLCARAHTQGPFVLTMADHVYDVELVTRAAAADMAGADLHLCVDRRLDEIFDMDDATKVRTEAGRIVDIGKAIPAYDCVDCGVFAVGPALFDALDAVRRARGDCSLSDGVKRLAAAGRARVLDIGDAFWQDVDTPEAAARAERILAGRARPASPRGG